MPTDEHLINAYLEGDEKSLETLADRYVAHLRAFALRLVGDAQAAEDIAQEAFIKAWKKARGFRSGENFRAWLFTIARNTAIDYLRKKKEVAFSTFDTAEGENPIVASLADQSPLADELLAQAEDVAFARQLLAELDPKYRDVLVLRHESDLTFAEIGEILKRPLHTVKSQYRRALATLNRALATQ